MLISTRRGKFFGARVKAGSSLSEPSDSLPMVTNRVADAGPGGVLKGGFTSRDEIQAAFGSLAARVSLSAARCDGLVGESGSSNESDMVKSTMLSLLATFADCGTGSTGSAR